MKSGESEQKPHDDVPLTAFEKRVFRTIILSSLLFGLFAGFVGFAFDANSWYVAATVTFFVSSVIGLIWFFQECMTSLRDYGLGEGIANLYGEDRAKFQFGNHYMRPDRSDD